MKNIASALCAIATAIIITGACAHAQSLNMDAGFTQKSLLNTADLATGFTFDSSGNLYDIASPASNPGDTVIDELTAASSFGSSTALVDYGTYTFGSFLTLQGSTLYYGDSANSGNINKTALPVATPPVAPTVIVTMTDNYDMTFSGTSTYVSANLSGLNAAANGVYKLNLSTGVYKQVLTTSDYSGPIAFLSNGNMLYGASGAASLTGIYEFTAAQVSNAITTNTPLQISSGTLFASNAGNTDFAISGNELFQAFSPYGGTSSLTEYNLTTGAATQIATISSQGDYFTGLALDNGNLTAAETDGGTFTDFIEVTAVIPEPGTWWLAAAGILLVEIVGNRRRAKKSKT
jgi:hypothetical protein